MEVEGTPQQLLIIFGPPAVGKMTVGRILADQLSYKLYYDEQVTELVEKYLSSADVGYWPLISKIRQSIFEGIAQSYLPGFVFTYIWDLDAESDKEYVENIISYFKEKLWKIKFVELEAKLGTRIKRSQGEDRIKAKPASADRKNTEAKIMEMEDYKHNTDDDFSFSPHLKINTTNMTAVETAEMIIEHYDLRQ